MKAAITGASGHIGAALCRKLLAQGYRVNALVHQSAESLEGLDLKKVPGDVLNPESLVKTFTDVNVVFHLAAKISIAGDPDGSVHEINVNGTKNVVEACLRVGVSKLIHFSSIHAFSPYPLDEEVNELREWDDQPGSFAYNRSKVNSEKEVLSGVEKGLNAVLLNPVGAMGPYDFGPSYIGEVLIGLCKGKIPALVKGGFNWVDVRDVAQAAIHAVDSGRAGGKYIIAGEWQRTDEMLTRFCKIAGVKPPMFNVPLWMAKAGLPFTNVYAKLTGTRELYTLESMEALNQYRYISTKKAQRELNFTPRPMEETLRDTYQWFKEHKL